MRIRVFRAFASNNSGSYTLVGSFRSPVAAERIAELLRAACAEHDAWHEAHTWEEDGEAPLDAFARKHGLHEEKPGRGDDWPQHGPAPEVLAIGHQVLLHAPYTVTLPRLFGELFFQHEGRVDLELNHSHERLSVTFELFVERARWGSPESKEPIERLVTELRAALPALVAPRDGEPGPGVAPAFHAGFWGMQLVTAVFPNLVDGVRAVREAAARHGAAVRVQVNECVAGLEDPLAPLRASGRPWGRARVILWTIGADRIRALKAAREVTGSALEDAKALLLDLPKEILVDVDHGFAERAAETLRTAGCDAEATLAPASEQE